MCVSLRHALQGAAFITTHWTLTTQCQTQVKSVALEGMAVLGKVMGAAEVQSMMRGGLPESLRSQVAARMANPVLPTVNLEGIVEHSTGPLPGDLQGTVHPTAMFPDVILLDFSRAPRV